MPTTVFVLVLFCWVGFASAFFLRKRTPPAQESKRAPASMLGLALQSAAYFIVWWEHRDPFTPIAPLGWPIQLALAVVAVALGVGSAWLAWAAVHTLGKEWSITARVLQEHKLATEGPYRLVRHPIYTGMLGMLLATGLAISEWPALLAALIVFGLGTAIRIRSEERLLREAFGPEFEAYARRVPALFPRLY